MSDSIQHYLLHVSWSSFWRVKGVVWNSALKKAYIISFFFFLRFVTLRSRHNVAVVHPQFVD